MRVQIDFYSKDEFSIHLDFAGQYPFAENETSELFILACFALRQLRNLGEHPSAHALAGILITSDCVQKAFLNKNKLEFPNAEALSRALISFTMQAVPKSWEMEKTMKVSMAAHERFMHPAPIRQALDNEIITSLPKLVEYHGKGRKSFEATFPPFLLKLNGFGVFGRDVNHHGFHAAIGLIRFLGKKHRGDSEYLEHVVEVARQCGSAYVFNQISSDQVAVANAILKTMGLG
jgi:hypothetical protein